MNKTKTMGCQGKLVLEQTHFVDLDWNLVINKCRAVELLHVFQRICALYNKKNIENQKEVRYHKGVSVLLNESEIRRHYWYDTID